MNYVILKADGSLLAQNMEYYVMQGDSGNEIFFGWVSALSTDVAIAVFILPNGDTNTVAGVYGSKTIEIDGVSSTYYGWTFTLTLAQTTYDGLLRMSCRVNRNNLVVVSYPLALVINETGVMPDTDSGVTIEELNSYLVQLQQLAQGGIRFYPQFDGNTTLQTIDNVVGHDNVFAFSLNGEVTFGLLTFDGGQEKYTLSYNSAYGWLVSESVDGSTKLSQLGWDDFKVGPLNVVTISSSGGTLSAYELSQIQKENCVLNLNDNYLRRAAIVSGTALFTMVNYILAPYLTSTMVSINLTTGVYAAPLTQSIQLYSQSEVDALLLAKEDKSNKVTSISSGSTDTQYPSAKCVYDNEKNIREVAEGKTDTYILSYFDTKTSVTNDISDNGVALYDQNGNDITMAFLNGDYDYAFTGSYLYGNASFNDNGDELSFDTDYLTLILRQYKDYPAKYILIILSVSNTWKLGTNIYVLQTNVPDRWVSANLVFSALETTKVDLSSYVDLTSTQTITGTKTFQGDLKFQGTGVSTVGQITTTSNSVKIGFGGVNHLSIDANAFYTNVADYSLGSSSKQWKDLYLSREEIIGSNSTAGQGKITFLNPDLTNQGNWYIWSENQNGIAFIQDTQGTGIKIVRGNMYPLTTNYFSLGSSSYSWKDLYLTGKIDFGNNAVINKDSSNRINILNNNQIKIKVGANETYFANHVEPDSNNTYDLGRTNVAWRYAYLSGGLKNADGTTTISVDNIANKQLTANDFSSSVTYTKGDLVIYNNTLYRMTADSYTAGDFDDTKFTATNVATELASGGGSIYLHKVALKDSSNGRIGTFSFYRNNNTHLTKNQIASLLHNDFYDYNTGLDVGFTETGSSNELHLAGKIYANNATTLTVGYRVITATTDGSSISFSTGGSSVAVSSISEYVTIKM